MWQFFQLFFIGVANLFYNIGLSIGEMLWLGRYGWWWRLRALMFVNYFFQSPYSAIKNEGRRAPVAMQNLIYGETPCLTMRKILMEVAPRASDHFVDLGCGRGLTVFFVSLYYSIPATGVEVLPSFVKRAQKIARLLGLSSIEFLRENLSWVTMEQIGRGTIFYLAGTTFEDELLAKIALRLEQLPKGVRLITLSEAIPSEQFQVTSVKPYYFTWGKTDVYFHEKIA